jgi:hypothetical protein
MAHLSTHGKEASRTYQRHIRQLSFELRKEDEAISQKVFLLKRICEQAEALELVIKIDMKGYQQKFDKYLNTLKDYERYQATSEDRSTAQACKA